MERMKRMSQVHVYLLAFAFFALSFSSGALFAQENFAKEQKSYVGFFGGAQFLNNPAVKHPDGLFDTDEQYDPGFFGGLFLGYRLHPSWRAEAELSYRKNSLDEVMDAAGNKQGGDGEMEAIALLASLYYDFSMDWLMDWPITPYVGAGIGYAHLNHVNKTRLAGLTDVDSKDDAFAYQMVAGISYDWAKRYTFFADYRFFATAIPKFKDKNHQRVDSEYVNHTVNLGVRVNF